MAVVAQAGGRQVVEGLRQGFAADGRQFLQQAAKGARVQALQRPGVGCVVGLVERGGAQVAQPGLVAIEQNVVGIEVAVEDAAGVQVCGGLGYVPGTDVERFSAEVGYWLGESLWNRGIATEALTLFTRYAFDELGLLRLFALPFADNAGSIRVLEKAGFQAEGVLRSSSVKFGKPRDQMVYAVVNARWSL